MAYVISDKCNKIGACKPVCPVDAISEGETKFIIDPELCVDCGTCAETCPSSAINPPQAVCQTMTDEKKLLTV